MQTPMFTKEEKERQLKDDFENFKMMMPMAILYAIEQSKLAKAKYNALVTAGFTEVQALELCTRL